MIYFWLDPSADYPPDLPDIEDVKVCDESETDELPIGGYEYRGSIYSLGELAQE